jgi:uncharacterized protein YdhG (YjbR/CyaY superfamily)
MKAKTHGPRRAHRPKRAAAGKRGSRMGRNPAPKNIDEYLARVPQPARSTLSRIRALIRSVAPPEATEAISYGIPAFKYRGMLVWFAAFSKHCSLFPGSSGIERFKDELKGFSISKGTIQFPADKPLPAALVKKLVKARIAQNESQKQR